MAKYIHIAFTEDLAAKEIDPYHSVLEYTSPFTNKKKAIAFIKRRMTYAFTGKHKTVYTRTFPRHVLSRKHERGGFVPMRERSEYEEYIEFRKRIGDCNC